MKASTRWWVMVACSVLWAVTFGAACALWWGWPDGFRVF